MIELDHIIPEPIKSTGINPASQTWDKELTFEKGKYYLVTAPSGKGKSTLVHIIYGLRKDFTGNIHYDGKNLAHKSLDELSELRQNKLSIVFQDLRLFPKLTAMENIEIKSALHQHKTSVEIKEMATRLGVDTLLEKPCATLSYGQRQRVAIIRALCQPFDFLMLDEPFSHLDKDNIKIANQLIQEALDEQEAGLILVSLGERYHFEYHHHIIL